MIDTDLRWWVEQGDAVEALKVIPSGSIDALVTDPPAGISFMGKEWDGAKGGRDKWIAWLASILRECLRTMKPGAYGWVWALPRTAHWTAMACEDAGFAVRDVLMHVQSQGFPKSRALLKPAAEHWILIKAPGELRELRIEENRIGTSKQVPASLSKTPGTIYGSGAGIPKVEGGEEQGKGGHDPNLGRWPANFTLSHCEDCADICVEDCPVRLLDEQSGELKSGKMQAGTVRSTRQGVALGTMPSSTKRDTHGDSGGASRFFYVAKPSTKERNANIPQLVNINGWRSANTDLFEAVEWFEQFAFLLSAFKERPRWRNDRNHHPTVKSIALMQHLISLIAAPGATILDPFTGSGSTGVAAIKNGCRFVGIEREAEYVEIARQRIHSSLL